MNFKESQVYTVSSVDVCPSEPVETNTIGSWRSRKSAGEECAAYIMDRVMIRPDIRYALMHNLQDQTLPSRVAEALGITEEELMNEGSFDFKYREDFEFPDGWYDAIFEDLEWTLARSSAYAIETDGLSDIGGCTFLFNITGNPLIEESEDEEEEEQ